MRRLRSAHLLLTILIFFPGFIYPCDGLVSGKSNSVCQQVMNAVASGDRKKMKAFIKANRHKMNDQFGRTPLMIAAIFGQFEVAELLMENGADVDAKDKLGFTPLIYAAGFRYVHKKYGLFTGMKETQAMFTLKNRVKVFRILFDRLADFDAKTKDGETVFTIVKKEGTDDFDAILAEVNFDDPQKDMFSDLIESSEPMRIPNYFNPWEDAWDETPEKIDSGELSVSDSSLEIKDTVYSLGNIEKKDGEKHRTLQVHVTEKEINVPGSGMSLSLWGERSILFNEKASLLLFEYYGNDKQIKAGLVIADPESRTVKIHALTINPGDDEELLSGYVYVLSKNYDSKKSEFKMKRSEDGWIFMLKNPDGVEGIKLTGEELDNLWERK